ncbi:MAG: PAS domain-containing protein [Anaerolineaceae bacterium]|nr:PAS domain-containing protein [Anaerolineaceae bacterium]
MRSKRFFQLAKDDLRLIEDAVHHAPQPELRQRASAIRLLHLGYAVEEVAKIADVTPTIVRRWRRAWCKGGLFALSDSVFLPNDPDTFLTRLTALQKASLELTNASTFEELCRQAIEKGLSQLGYDRLGIFFLTDKPNHFIPSFGTGEDGKPRDERQGEPVEWHDTDDIYMALERQQDLIIRFECPLYSDDGVVVGHGWNVMAALWDGQKIIGFLAADNLINHKPLTDADIQILRLYGLTLGSLCSVKSASEALLKERNMLRAVMDSTLDMIYVKDRQSRVIMTNTVSVPNTTHVATEQDMIGLTDFDYLPQHLAQRFYNEEQHLMRTGIPILNREEPGVDRDGNNITYLTTKVPLRDSQGEIVGLVGVSRDISELKHSEEQNLRLMLENERVELMQQLVSNISHDLKTPLSVIKTSLYLLERLEDPKRQKDKLQTIKEQAERLEKLIQDILTVSRLDQFDKQVRDPVDIAAIVRSVAKNLQARADAKNQVIKLELADSISIIRGNAEDLWRMVANLVENAINYTPEKGLISIETRYQATSMVMLVRDTGIGIDKDQLPLIFERFYRADSARSMQNGGTGLGLSIVKLIAEQHGGNVKVESTVGEGTCFQVWIPCESD